MDGQRRTFGSGRNVADHNGITNAPAETVTLDHDVRRYSLRKFHTRPASTPATALPTPPVAPNAI